MNIEHVYKLRRDALQNLIDTRYSGNTAEFCRVHSLDENRIRHLLNSVRNFGEKAARKMEEVCGLPDFYFDIQGDRADMTLIENISKLNKEDRQAVLRLLQSLSRQDV